MTSGKREGVSARLLRFGVAVGAFEAHVAPFRKDGYPLHEEDLALAFSCANRSEPALLAFEETYGGEFAAVASRLRMNRTEIEEVTQRTREKIFVGTRGRGPKILEYAGRGTLLAWLRVVIVRTALDYRREEGLEPSPAEDPEPLIVLTESQADPELLHIRAKYREPFRNAFHDAVRALSPDERNVLRLYVVERLNIEQIGNLCGVHRATVARWISAARESLLTTTKRLLKERLHLTNSEFDSLVRICQSGLDLALSQVT